MLWRVFKAQRLHPYRFFTLLATVLLLVISSVAYADAPRSPDILFPGSEEVALMFGACSQ